MSSLGLRQTVLNVSYYVAGEIACECYTFDAYMNLTIFRTFRLWNCKDVQDDRTIIPTAHVEILIFRIPLLRFSLSPSPVLLTFSSIIKFSVLKRDKNNNNNKNAENILG